MIVLTLHVVLAVAVMAVVVMALVVIGIWPSVEEYYQKGNIYTIVFFEKGCMVVETPMYKGRAPYLGG